MHKQQISKSLRFWLSHSKCCRSR